MLSDYHVHSYYSDDSVYPMEDVVKDAISKGITELCFTEHVDYGIKEDVEEGKEIRYRGEYPLTNCDYPKYVEEITNLQNKYRNQILIKMGMEFGMQRHTIDQFQALFDKYPFDFILLSCHQVNDKEFYMNEFMKGKTQIEYNREYYTEILNVVREYKDYSVLAHLDLIVRYDEFGACPFEYVEDIIVEILKQVIRDGKGIELNTSFHRYGLSDSTPSRKILELYRELGGTIITIGSDSHKPEHLGAYLEEAWSTLMDIGYEYYCTFDQMKPVFHRFKK